MFLVILPSGAGVSVYVDPTTYQDLADAVREFAKELDRQWIQLERIIGGGVYISINIILSLLLYYVNIMILLLL